MQIPPSPPAIERPLPPLQSLIPAHWKPQVIHANGIDQQVWRTGDGSGKPVLVLLPGFTETGLTWLRFARAAEADFDVVMVDFRGQGGTTTGSSGYTQGLLASDVAALVREARLEAPCLVGFSNGAGVAAQVAASAPELVRCVVLEEPGWDPSPMLRMANSPQFQAFFDQWAAGIRRLASLPWEAQVNEVLGRLLPGAAHWAMEDAVPAVASFAAVHPDFLDLGRALLLAADPPVKDLITAIRCPVLLLRAEQGMMPGMPAPRRIADDVRGHPHVRLVQMPTGHFVRRERFDEYVQLVTGFARSPGSTTR